MTEVLLFDLSNLLYHSAHRLHRGFERRLDAASLILEAAENHMRELYRQFRPQQFWFACDDSRYWRSSHFPAYKAQRQVTPVKTLVRKTAEIFKEKHAKFCLQVPEAEADDVIYVATQILPGLKIIISTDRDFLQLLSKEVKLYNPLDSYFRQLEHSVEYALFVKCIRGDPSDNIPSAYPRVTERRLKKAFADPGERELLLSTVLPDKTRVQTHYERNRTLIDLSCLPNELREKITEIVLEKLSQTQ